MADEPDAPPAGETIPYDPNQKVRLVQTLGPIHVEANADQTSAAVKAVATDAGGEGEDDRAAAIRSQLDTCQETLRQAMLHMFSQAGEDVTTFDGLEHSLWADSATGGVGSAAPGAGGDLGETVPSVPVDEAEPTAAALGLRDQLDAFREELADTLSDFEIAVTWQRQPSGAVEARVRTRRGGEAEAEPTDEPDEAAPEAADGDAGDEPVEVRRIVRRVGDDGAVSLTVRPPGAALATAEGDTGAGIHNSFLAQNNKRQTALFANDFGNVQIAANVAFTLNLILGGVETD